MRKQCDRVKIKETRMLTFVCDTADAGGQVFARIIQESLGKPSQKEITGKQCTSNLTKQPVTSYAQQLQKKRKSTSGNTQECSENAVCTGMSGKTVIKSTWTV